jgi:hypothetical protein
MIMPPTASLLLISPTQYLLALNHAVGRGTMDARLPAVLPWVSDLSVPWGGWRDLGKSKLRITKAHYHFRVPAFTQCSLLAQAQFLPCYLSLTLAVNFPSIF